jgi:hypothetical protein
LNCAGDCMFKMQLQERTEDTGTSEHEIAQDAKGM